MQWDWCWCAFTLYVRRRAVMLTLRHRRLCTVAPHCIIPRRAPSARFPAAGQPGLIEMSGRRRALDELNSSSSRAASADPPQKRQRAAAACGSHDPETRRRAQRAARDAIKVRRIAQDIKPLRRLNEKARRQRRANAARKAKLLIALRRKQLGAMIRFNGKDYVRILTNEGNVDEVQLRKIAAARVVVIERSKSAFIGAWKATGRVAAGGTGSAFHTEPSISITLPSGTEATIRIVVCTSTISTADVNSIRKIDISSQFLGLYGRKKPKAQCLPRHLMGGVMPPDGLPQVR